MTIDKVTGKFIISVVAFVLLYLLLNNTHSAAPLSDLYVYCLLAFLTFAPPIVFVAILRFSRKYRIILCCSVFMWLLLSLFLYIPTLNSLLYPALENKCKLTIRELAKLENTFYNDNNRFASFDEFAELGYIQPGYTANNLIDQYSVEVIIEEPFENSTELSAFTIFAYPKPTVRRFRYLRTFYVTRDEMANLVESR